MNRRTFLRTGATCTALGPLFVSPGSALTRPRNGGQTPSDASRLLTVVRQYADTLLAEGRDRYGDEASPLVAAILDRETLQLPKGERLEELRNLPRSQWEIRPQDRILTGANPMHDQNLYQVLYALAEVTGADQYREAADTILKTFFSTCQHSETGLLGWGEHSGWDFRTGTFIDRPGEEGWGYVHEFFRPWVLWEQSFDLAPGACRRFARGLWKHQIDDSKTGNFSRHARIDRHDPGQNSEYPRHGGFYIATWAHAYQETGEEVFLRAIRTLVEYFNERRSPQSDALPAESASRSQGKLVWPHSSLGLAVDLHRHAARVPDPLSQRMKSTAQRTDEVFLRLDHRLDDDGWGFVTACDTDTLEPGDVRGADRRFTARKWATGYGDATDARIALICHLRYQQTEDERYRRLIMDTADRYLEGRPDSSIPLFPGTMGHVLLLETAAAEMTGADRYRTRAHDLADFALETFWSGANPLPRASSHHSHYEAITRADTLVMALLRLWGKEQDRDRSLSLRFNDR